MKFKKTASVLMLMGAVGAVSADVCKINPGSVTCGKGTVDSLTGNGMVTASGTTVKGPAIINGMLKAEDTSFQSLKVNGNTSLIQCTVNEIADVKGGLDASSTKFERTLDIYSTSIRLINSKVNENLHIHHNMNKDQEVYLDNNSEVGGDVIFDDGHGKVYVRGGSKINGNVIGGKIVN